MNKKEEKKVGTTLSYILRHKPEEFNITLDKRGFTTLDEVVRGLNTQYKDITIQDIIDIVDNDTKRYEIVDNSIRALYGHSFGDKIAKDPIKPPDSLYHGTTDNVIDIILEEGLKEMNRQYVHLSLDLAVAQNVADRRINRESIILVVDSKLAYEEGINFYKEPKNIYLSDRIPAKYLKILE